MNQISFEEFCKLDLRVGEIISATTVEGSNKLLKLEVDLGEKKTIIMAGIAEHYPEPEKIISKQIIVVVNIAPRTIMGIESRGMLLGAEDENGKYQLLKPDDKVKNGSRIS
jgi:methionyl-tRNA synthetase